ncbi:DNA-protecting protein DprA [Campylobacter sp. JMF_04 NA10]|uniref:DNA-processing protein DprA n=1 Tax=Campylobacter sp. JMF_04 NA10 TaxID=2983824 RepID=UPI0022E9F29C|nr:DNA-processing protein DprA [Campylobacter sp. JMF_04 NA10]MDA3076690.1 DNA-protecting protein DprA [Campylobacter sp. JMF_04 NA10]
MNTTNELNFKIPALSRLGKTEPKTLYYKGNLELLDMPKIAIVGSRKMSIYTKNLITKLAQKLSNAGICVVSGAAIGCDITAHEGAFSRTIAVFANGLDEIYPKQNEDMIRKIYAGALALSEYEDGTPARNFQFLERNRIVVALCQALIVAQAEPKSGSLQSARIARELGIPVFVLPHRIDESVGTNELLAKKDATLISDLDKFVAKFSGKEKPKNLFSHSDEILDFVALNSSLDEALMKFGERIYEYELEGKIIIEATKISLA